MKYYRELFLKDGRICILRNSTAEDAEEILSLMRNISRESENLLRYPEEWANITNEDEARFLRDLECSDDAIMLVAVIDGRIVGSAGLNPISRLEKCRHRADIGMSIRKEYWGRGIGSSIMEAILEIAQKAGFKQLELEVLTENTRAISLYEKFDFSIFGTNNHAFSTRGGQYKGSYLMSRYIKSSDADRTPLKRNTPD